MTVAPPIVRVLGNGLTVALDVHRSVPRVAAHVVARWGAGDDPRERTGLAHLLEHLLANKGTARLGVVDPTAEARLRRDVAVLYRRAAGGEDVAADLERAEKAAARLAIPNELKTLWGALGGRGLNASTSHDRTEYRVDVPSARLGAWAQLEADRFAAPAFRTFGTELGTVLEEIARAADDPNRVSWSALRGLLFGAHPYGTPVLGRGEHVAGATPDDAEGFFRAGHGARNLVVCLAGDLDPDGTLALLEKTLGQLPSGAPRPGPLGEPPPLRGEHRVTLQHEAEPEVRIAWRGVSANHPDHHALLLADMLLDNRAGGLLRRRLVHAHRVRAAGSVRMTLREAGAHVLWARPLEGQEPSEVEGLLLDGVAALQAGEFAAAELDAILKNFEVGELRRLEDPGPRAARLVRAVAWERDLAAVYGWRAPLEAVTPEDVVRVARRYLGADRVIVNRTRGVPLPTRAARASAGARTMAEHAQSAFAAEILATPGPVSGAQVLQEGADFTVRSDNWGETVLAPGPTEGLSRLSLRIPFGIHHAPTWAHAVHLLDQSGAGARSRGETEDALYRMGVSWDISPGRVATDLVVDGPSDALEGALLLLAERIAEPRLEPAEAAARMEDLLLRRREGRTARRVRGSALDRWVLRGEESEYRSGAPDAASLRALASAPLGMALDPLRTFPMDAVLTGAGPVERRVRALWQGGAVAPLDSPVRYSGAAADRVLLCHQAGAQARVALLCPGPPVPPDGPPDAARRVWDEILGGPASLFFQEIREARGLAYSTRGRASRGRGPGDDTVLWAVTMCDAARVAEVASLMVRLLRAPTASAARFARARHALLARDAAHRIRPRAIAGTVAAWRRWGYVRDPRPGRRAALGALQIADFMDYRAMWAARPLTVTVLADLERVDADALDAIGPVETLVTADLFSY